jgi:hypothetical protein
VKPETSIVSDKSRPIPKENNKVLIPGMYTIAQVYERYISIDLLKKTRFLKRESRQKREHSAALQIENCEQKCNLF